MERSNCMGKRHAYLAHAKLNLLCCIAVLFLLLITGRSAFASVTPQVSARGGYSLALKSDGTVWAWGNNQYGQLGDGTTESSSTPVQVSDLSNVIAIAAGNDLSLALKSDGTVWAWGFNGSGQLGNGTTKDSSTPLQVSNLSDVIAIAAGLASGMALRSDDTVRAWGNNQYGQLGDGTTEDSSTPIQVSNLSGAIAIAAGAVGHSLALKSNGTVWAWGNNQFGQLGDGTTESNSTPVQVSNLIDVIAIGGGEYHSLALKSNGIVLAWGWNDGGQLGDGTKKDKHTPVKVHKLSGIIAIDGGGASHNLALKSNGKVWTWGWNKYGQLGDGTTTNRTAPIRVKGLSGIVAINGSGGTHSLALKSDGTVWAWGNNSSGQLGDGTTKNRLTPVQVKDLNLGTSKSKSHMVDTETIQLIPQQ